ncbi:hypothetical protein BC826DRAFT_992917 [Russula brevipes]|nr:hypothetical protein BC826DRAFT_992917 [Russula brevipes]
MRIPLRNHGPYTKKYSISAEKGPCAVWALRGCGEHLCTSAEDGGVSYLLPRRLDLRLVCTHKTPVRKSLDIWPPLPINIRHSYKGEGGDEEGILAAFEQRDRVVEIVLDGVTPSTVVSLVTVMRESFPVLRHLFLGSNYTPLYLPNAFFCGLGPSLRSLVLENVLLPSQAFRKVLSSATHLVKLWLSGLPYTPFSPEAIATYIATLPNLEDFRIGFQRPRIYAYQAIPPLLTPAVLPALTSFQFTGPCGYLEDLVPLIDTPKLQTLSITFINRRIHIAQLRRFISRVGWPKPPNRATVEFGILDVGLRFTSSDSFELAIRCSHLAGQLSSMTRVCNELSPLLSHVVHLKLSVPGNRLAPRLIRPFDFTQWLQFLRRFMTVRDLYVSKKLGSSLASALQELTGEKSAEYSHSSPRASSRIGL